jgi:hypothetical protein
MTKKNHSIKYFYLSFFDQKCKFTVLHKGCPSYRRSLQLSKENIQHFKRWNLLTALYFSGSFLPFWNRIQSGNRIKSGVRIRLHNTAMKRKEFGVPQLNLRSSLACCCHLCSVLEEDGLAIHSKKTSSYLSYFFMEYLFHRNRHAYPVFFNQHAAAPYCFRNISSGTHSLKINTK